MRPRLAPGFTVMSDASAVWLVAGEDVRYRLGAADPAWLRALLERCDGARAIDELAAGAPAEHRGDARVVLERLAGERVLVDGAPVLAHVASAPSFRVEGTGAVAQALGGDGGETVVFVQDRLDHAALLARNREALARRERWMWISTGPGARAYLSPLFVPGAGPCAACLILHWKRLSPAPELYDVVLAHAGPIAPTPFPAAGIAVVAALASWKLSLVEAALPAALYALHVVEVDTLAVSSHEPFADPECEACR